MRASIVSSRVAARATPWRTQHTLSAHWVTFTPRQKSPCLLHNRCLTRLFASSSQEEQRSAESPSQEEPAAVKEDGASGGGEDDSSKAEAPPEPLVIFKATHLTQQHSDALRMVNISAYGSSIGLGAALLGVAPFTAPNIFMVALLLAAFQVRLAHTMTLRVLRAQVRRHVEEIVQLDAGSFSIRSGNGTVRTLHLSSAGAVGERPPLCEILQHGGPFVFIDRENGTIEAPDALQALMESDRAIRSEDLAIDTFEDESEDEARKLVQSLAKISKSELDSISKKQGAVGTTAPKVALAQAAMQAQLVSGVIFVVGTVIGYSGWQQAEVLPAGSVTLGPPPRE